MTELTAGDARDLNQFARTARISPVNGTKIFSRSGRRARKVAAIVRSLVQPSDDGCYTARRHQLKQPATAGGMSSFAKASAGSFCSRYTGES
jgi:hypothetical protein